MQSTIEKPPVAVALDPPKALPVEESRSIFGRVLRDWRGLIDEVVAGKRVDLTRVVLASLLDADIAS